MHYGTIERRLAAMLDSVPRLRAVAKAGYQRANYLLRGWRRRAFELHPQATIQRVAGGARGHDGRGGREECYYGYFGLQPWSRDGNRYLFHRWRPPDAQTVQICLHDVGTGTARVVAQSRAWNFQQGSLAQWLGIAGTECIAFNDAVDRRLVCRVLAADGQERRLEWPIQAVHPSGGEALSLNYRRLARLRSEYGYDVTVDNFAPDQPLDRDGLWRVDLRTGDASLTVSLRQLVDAAPRAEMAGAGHEINHAVYSPAGTRFLFMHRWLGPRGKFSRLYCANADGSRLRLLLDNRMVSHYAWRDEKTFLVWARAADGRDGYYVLDASTGEGEPLLAGSLDRYGDGHPSYSADGGWIVTDTYPDRARMRRLLLCRPSTGIVIEAGAFHSPWRYDGPRRCDLHPRWNRSGSKVSIDSAHEGFRATYVIDVSRLLADAG